MHKWHWLRVLVEPRSVGDDLRRREFILNVLLVSSTVISLGAFLIVVVRLINLGANYTGVHPFLALMPAGLFVGLWVLSRKGLFILSAYLLVAIFLLLAFYTLFTWGILLPQGLLLLVLVLVMSSILLGTAVGAGLNILAAVILVALSWLQQTGKIALDDSWMKTPGGPADAIGFALTFGVVTTVSWLSNREIERFNITLQERIQKATARLRSANKNLKVLDKTKDEFISMASHQLGTPLTAITGYLSMALDEDKHNMTDAQRQYIEYALEASERMGAMSSDLLNVSRLSAGRFVIRREPVELIKMVGEEVAQLRHAAERKGLELSFTSSALPVVEVDSSKTRQVIMNFIDNAIYYTEHGSIKVNLERQKNEVVFTVKDTGIGVPPDERKKLFAKFYRAENAKVTRPDGTGLGLYLAKRVVEDQGGTIIFESEIGQGSTFGFKLPIIIPQAPAGVPPKPQQVAKTP